MPNFFRTDKESEDNLSVQNIILLENDGTLPLPKNNQEIAIYGSGNHPIPDRSADIAVYMISRHTEGELTPTGYELSRQEKQELNSITAAYPKTVVILNTDNVIDTRYLRSHSSVSAILLISPAEDINNQAIVDILTGQAAPSGRLDIAWAENYEDYRAALRYGYQYFDTFGVKPAYPFGFGRSYTSFSVSPRCVIISGQNVLVHASVTNIGVRCSGQEMVQVYYSAPDGKLKKPYQNLAGFIRTQELVPGETEQVTVSFPLISMAAYDEGKAVWVLEEGLYYIRVGTHSRNTHIAAALYIDREVIIEQCPSSHNTTFAKLPARIAAPYTYEGEAREKESAIVIDVITSTLKPNDKSSDKNRTADPALRSAERKTHEKVFL